MGLNTYRYILLLGDNMNMVNFNGNIKKRFSKVSYNDWLGYTSRFLRTFDSAYKEPCNIKIGETTYRFDLDGGIGGLGGYVEQLEDKNIMFKSEDIKLDKSLQKKISNAIPEDVFRKESGLMSIIEPNPEEALEHGGVGYGNFYPSSPKNIDFYAQGKIEVVRNLYRELRSKGMKDALTFRFPVTWRLKEVHGIDL